MAQHWQGALRHSATWHLHALSFPSWTFPNLSLPSWKVVGLRLGEVLEQGVRPPNVSVLLVSFVPFCRTRWLIRSGYVGGQLVITRNILSFSFFTIIVTVRPYIKRGLGAKYRAQRKTKWLVNVHFRASRAVPIRCSSFSMVAMANRGPRFQWCIVNKNWNHRWLTNLLINLLNNDCRSQLASFASWWLHACRKGRGWGAEEEGWIWSLHSAYLHTCICPPRYYCLWVIS